MSTQTADREPLGADIDPDRIAAVLFDLDGVVTDTATLHRAAWQVTFDEYLSNRAGALGEDRRPFTDDDYLRYVDGRRREDGVESFLASRGMAIARGGPDDPVGADTAYGLGKLKDQRFRENLTTVRPFESTIVLIRRLHREGVATAVFSASRNCRAVLEAAGAGDLFAVRVDGTVADRLGLPGKPDPAMLLEAATRLGVAPARCAVVEDASAGVEAGRRGGFGRVIGVARNRKPEDLLAHGADVVVNDLAQVDVVRVGSGRAPGRT